MQSAEFTAMLYMHILCNLQIRIQCKWNTNRHGLNLYFYSSCSPTFRRMHRHRVHLRIQPLIGYIFNLLIHNYWYANSKLFQCLRKHSLEQITCITFSLIIISFFSYSSFLLCSVFSVCYRWSVKNSPNFQCQTCKKSGLGWDIAAGALACLLAGRKSDAFGQIFHRHVLCANWRQWPWDLWATPFLTRLCVKYKPLSQTEETLVWCQLFPCQQHPSDLEGPPSF